MKYPLLLPLILLASTTCSAQNWQTLRIADTAWFSAGTHTTYTGRHYYPDVEARPLHLRLLRQAFVASALASGSDSVFRLFSSLRDTSTGSGPSRGCIDTTAPSWLGPQMIRKPGGIELYFNSRVDTIRILTHAKPGDRWTLASDAAGRHFVGTITQHGVTMVDGAADSFKTIAIQAYLGVAPVPHPYNTLVLQLSKNHGWLRTLDLYRFPDRLTYRDENGIAIDSTQHFRLPASYRSGRMGMNISFRYSPGNAWIWKVESEFSANPDRVPQELILHRDSVLDFQPLPSGAALVTLRTALFFRFHKYSPNAPGGYFDSSSLRVWTHTDSLVDNPYPFFWMDAETGWYSALMQRWFVKDFDSVRAFITNASLDYKIPVSGGDCVRLSDGMSAPDDYSSFRTYLPDFGPTAAYSMRASSSGTTEVFLRHIYIRTGTTVFGEPFDVEALRVPGTAFRSRMSVSPNPAGNEVRISIPESGNPLRLRLCDITGQPLRTMSATGGQLLMQTADLPPGIYFLECSGSGFHETQKLQILH